MYIHLRQQANSFVHSLSTFNSAFKIQDIWLKCHTTKGKCMSKKQFWCYIPHGAMLYSSHVISIEQLPAFCLCYYYYLPLIFSFVCHLLAKLSTKPVLQLHCLRLLYVHAPEPLLLLPLLSQQFYALNHRQQPTVLCSFSFGQLFVLSHAFAHDWSRVT
jgi:hypothetical protein